MRGPLPASHQLRVLTRTPGIGLSGRGRGGCEVLGDLGNRLSKAWSAFSALVLSMRPGGVVPLSGPLSPHLQGHCGQDNEHFSVPLSTWFWVHLRAGGGELERKPWGAAGVWALSSSPGNGRQSLGQARAEAGRQTDGKQAGKFHMLICEISVDFVLLGGALQGPLGRVRRNGVSRAPVSRVWPLCW